jgi:hypothetical protein
LHVRGVSDDAAVFVLEVAGEGVIHGDELGLASKSEQKAGE